MKYFEFGKEHPELMVMLRGGGVCYRGALAVAVLMNALRRSPAIRSVKR